MFKELEFFNKEDGRLIGVFKSFFYIFERK